MSPLTLVGILVITSTTLADVKHVLEGSAQPPEPNSISPQAVNYLASNPPNSQYWWMNSNSPLKAAYDYYKKCTAKANCLAPINPEAPIPQPFVPQEEVVNINIKKNPFLNGNVKPSNANFNDKNTKIDISKNPFLSGSVVTTGNGAPVAKDQDGFLGVQPAQPFNKKPGFATTHPLEQKKKPGFATTHPLDEKKQNNLLNITVECKGAGFACVEKSLCIKGVVNKNGEGLLQVRSDVRYCHEDTEVCCQMNNLNEITAGKSTVPESTIKFAGGAGFSPGLIHVQPLNVQPDIVFAGEHGHHSSSTSKAVRDTSSNPNSVFSSTVDYSDTKFDSDVRFASTFQGPPYLPPLEGTTPAPRPFETKRPNVNQEFVPSRPSSPGYVQPSPTTPRPFPSTFRPAPSSPSFPSSTFRPEPSITTSREYLPPRSSTPRPTGTVTQYVPPQQPYTQRPYQPSVTPQKPYQPSVTTQRPYQPSVTPQKPYQPSVTPQKPYQPSVTPQQPYQPSITTQRPYQPSVTPQQPYQPSVTPQKPYQPSITPQQPCGPGVTPQSPYQSGGSPQLQCQPSVTPQKPYQPSVTPQQPYQPSVTPQKPYQPSVTTSRPYQPSVTPQKPYQPSVTPQKPYQPSITPQQPYQPSITTERPYQPSITPAKPYQPSVTPQPSCGPGETLQYPSQPGGRPQCQPSVTPQRPYQPSVIPQPSCRPGETLQYPSQPGGTPQCRPIVTPQKPYQPSVTPQPSCGPGETLQYPSQPGGRPQCQPSVTPQRPYQPSVTSQPSCRPGEILQYPSQPGGSPQCQPSVTPQRPYQPSSPSTFRPYQPQPTTSRPYQPPQQPYQPSTSRPTTSREYLPPRTSVPFVPQPSSPRPNPFLPLETTPSPSYPRPTPGPQYPSQPSFPSFPQPKPTTRPQFPSPSQPTGQPSFPSFPQPKPTTRPQFPSPSQPTGQPSFPSFPQPIPTSRPRFPTPSQPSQQPSFPSFPQPQPTPRPQYPSQSPPTGQPSFPSFPQPKPTPKPQFPSPPQPSGQPSFPSFPQPKPTPRPEVSSPSQPSFPGYPRQPPPHPPFPTPSQPTRQPSFPSFPQTSITQRPSQYPSPSQPTGQPSFPSFPQPSPTPRPQFPSPSQPGGQPSFPSFPQPTPTPRPELPSRSQPSFPAFPQTKPTPRPQYPSPSQSTGQPSFPSFPQPKPTLGPQFPSPSQPTGPGSTDRTPLPFRPTPSIPKFPSPVTNGYQYPTPSSPRPNPFIPQQSTPSRPPTNYQPSTPSRPAPSPRPYQPSTEKPYVPPQQPTGAPNPAGGYEYPKPTPTFGYPSTSRPVFGNNNVNNQYIPPPQKPRRPGENPDQSYEAANVDGAFVRPTSPRVPFQGELNTAPPPGCAAALKCVQEIYCTAEGVISPVPVVLTKEQELIRVPTTVCQDTESGIIGKCCRDPNYKDPWPSANLVDGVDDGQYKEDDSIGQYQQDLQRNVRSNKGGPRQDSSDSRNTNFQTVPQPTCGERHRNTNPPGPGPLDVNFAEIPWQAMILRDSNRSLLCGGAIIRRDVVITTAHCVDGLETSDILIKGGEWKLGIDEEPLPFQIVKVTLVVKHPQYQKGSLVNDLALLILEEKLRPSKNIGMLCLPPPNQIPTQNCIATGWGKRILQLHARGAIMHAIDVKIMDNKQCQDTLSSTFQHALTNYSPNTLCGYSDIDQCRVDYGSALACTDGDRYVLSGIYSWDTGCKQRGQIGGYIAPDVEWIESTMAKSVAELRKLQQK